MTSASMPAPERGRAARPEGGRPLTGWHVLAMFAAGFGIVIAVNVTLAVAAVRTFPGLETQSSYVASQTFDDDRAAQLALGWQVSAAPRGEDLVLSIRDASGRPVEPRIVSATLGRPTSVAQDSAPAFAFDGADFVAPAPLGLGNWNLRLEAEAADGTVFRQRVVIRVRG